MILKALRIANVKRCEQVFHSLNNWTPTDWATAMAGECGEACNIVKKMRRIGATPEIVNAHYKYWTDRNKALLDYKEYSEYVNKLADEIADTIIYADLLAARMGIDLEQAIRNKFNEVSEKRGSSVFL